MTEFPVAVIMSTFNEERDIDRSLDAVLHQDVPAEIIVIDGGSSDGTVARLQARASEHRRLRVIADGVRRSLPQALNVAIEHTDAPLIAKVDARTFIAPDFLARAMAVFAAEDERVACVGGRPEQYGDTAFGQGLALARMSPFGVGGSGYADTREHADVDTVQCGVYRRDALITVGAFDPALQYGEDEELNWRLRSAGYRIVRDTSIRFRYSTRPTWESGFRQYRNYGRARVMVAQKHPGFLRAYHVVPSVAVATMGFLAVASLVSPRARAALAGVCALYAAGCLGAAAFAVRGGRGSLPHTAAAFSSLHAGYGIGLLEGLLKTRRYSS